MLCSDHISYEKGSAVLKMLVEVIGESKFLSGTCVPLSLSHCLLS